MNKKLLTGVLALLLLTACGKQTAQTQEETDVVADKVWTTGADQTDVMITEESASDAVWTTAESIQADETTVTEITANADVSPKELLKEMKNCIERSEYGKAVVLYEENIDMCSSDKSFSSVYDELINYFSKMAKLYYTHTATYLTIQMVNGYDCNTGFEGYNAEDNTLDPTVLDDLLSDSERIAMNRVKIICESDSDGYPMPVSVTIDVCGTQAVYPANDVML